MLSTYKSPLIMIMKQKQLTKSLPLKLVMPISCLALFSPTTQAQNELTEDLFYEEIPIVLTASRIQQPLNNVPAAITIIDQKMIQASGAIEIVDLLRLVPGFQVGFVSGHKFTATYHGNNDQYARDLQVLIDGRSVYDPAFGGVAWSDLPLDMDDIQRIEVIRGPNAAAYGSNAFSGVINFITKHPATQQGVRTHVTAGEGDTRNIVARYGGNQGELDYRLSVSYDENSGFEERVDSSDTRWVNFRGDYSLSNSDSLQFQLGYSKGNREDGFIDDEVQPLRDIEDTYHFQQMRWTRTVSPENEYSLQFYHNYQQFDDDFDTIIDEIPYPYHFYHLGLGFESRRLDIEFQNNISNADGWKLAWGLGARQDQSKSLWVLNSDESVSRNQLRAFINGEKTFSDVLTLNLGTMIESFEGHKPLHSPRIALNWHTNNQNTFRIAASQAYRMPTLVEQHADQIVFSQVDPSLDLQFYLTEEQLTPEKIRSFEIGYLGLFADNTLTIDAKLFHEKKSNILTGYEDETTQINPAPLFSGYSVSRFGNEGDLEINGLEWGLKWEPNNRSLIHLAYSYAKANGEKRKKIDASGKNETQLLDDSVPEQSFSLLGSYRFRNGYQISSSFYYVDYMDYGGDGDKIPHASRWDMKFSKNFTLDRTDGNISLILQNINDGDVDFYNSPDDFQINRWDSRVFLQLDLTWP